MAYYCQVFDVTRPNPGIIMIHFNMHDDVDDSVVQGPITHGFQIVTYNIDGTVKTETGQQKLNRMATEFNNYAARLITDATMVDANFETVRTAAIGYRYPTAV